MTPNTSSSSTDRFGVYQADSRQLFETLAEQFDPDELDGLVDATVTSPPYADIKDYGYEEQIGNGDPYDQYLDDLREVFKNIYEVTADDGSLWVNINNRQFDDRVVDIKAHIIEAVENLENKQRCSVCGDRLRRNGETGELYCTNVDDHDQRDDGVDDDGIYRYDPSDESWICHTEIIWDKQKSNDERDGVRNVFEYVLVFKKTDKFSMNEDARIYDPSQLKEWWISDTYNYSPTGATYPNVWDIPAETTGGWGDDDLDHDAVFPAALVERMIEMSTEPGDVVLDPFAGSGTSLAVAELMDRQSIGFELNPEYIDLHESRYASIEKDWKEDHLSLAERKQRYAEATWALRHHGYVKWLFTTLRSQVRDVAGPHDLWQALGAADISTTVSFDETVLSRGLAVAIDETPLASFLQKAELTESDIRAVIATEKGKEDPTTISNTLVEERLAAERITLLRHVLQATEQSQTAILAATLEELDDAESVELTAVVKKLIPAGNQTARGDASGAVEAGQYTKAAEALLDVTSLESVFVSLATRVPAEIFAESVGALDKPTQATLGNWGTEEDADSGREDILLGALLAAIVYTTDLALATDVECIEPLLDPYRKHGDRFGIHAVVVQPETATGTPPEGEDRVPVTQSFLFNSEQAAVDSSTVLDAAVEYLLEEKPSSNAKKLRRHGLNPSMEWISGNEFAEKVETLGHSPDEFYLYEAGRHERYRTAFDSDGLLWDRCTSNPAAWEDKYCSRTSPAVISPLALAISEAKPDKPRYQIDHINNFGDLIQTTTEGGNSTLF
ncbi:DNA-methyltransferase [Salinigranum halophilum]|uniref:DNA-methyltransferase n=1 Tax=Salinigranum halophilum TaxID=2565931 RepID=UPI0010A902F5|nr:site-specific DNA-methyltransferase [Salinigranum halophilum]